MKNTSSGTSIIYEVENIDTVSGDIHPNNTNVYRWSNYQTIYIKLYKDVVFNNTFYYQPEIKNFKDFRFYTEGEFEFKISDKFLVIFSFDYLYDSDPPSGIKKYDFGYETGFVITF